MNFLIVLIEDSIEHQNAFNSLLQEWSLNKAIPINLLCYSNAEEFLEHKKDWKFCNCIFLDIDLPGINGIETAQLLRTAGIMTDFVFLTSFSEYVFDGYSVNAVDYLIKPLDISRLDRCMQKLISKFQNGFYVFRTATEIIQIPFHEILYFQSSIHRTEIITLNHNYSIRKPLSSILKNLPKQFVRIHRTLIININNVYSLMGSDVIMTNREHLPVSKTHLKEVTDIFMDRIF